MAEVRERPGLLERVSKTRLWRAIWYNPYPTDRRTRAKAVLESLSLHLHAAQLPRRAVRLGYTFGAGGLSFYMFLILTVSGAVLMFYYIPSVEAAYESMLALETRVLFGSFLRNIHRWAAHTMVILVTFHMVRVFYTAGYTPPREFNWGLGVTLWVTTLLLSFTGYLLPWDQLAYWAITVGTNIAGYVPLVGNQVRLLLLGAYNIGQPALIRWYTLHVVFLPVIAAFLMALHFFRVRQDGFSNPAKDQIPATQSQVDPAERVHVWPHLLAVEMVGAVVFLLALSAAAVLFKAPLLELADAEVTPNPSKAPWYFLGLQELLLHMDPTLAGVLVPGAVLLGLALIPWIDFDKQGTGIWFSEPRRGIPVAVISAVVTAGLVVGLILFDEFVAVGATEALKGPGGVRRLLAQVGAPDVLGAWLIPIAIITGFPALLAWALRRRYGGGVRTTMIALFTYFLASFIILTVVGTAFRGPGMRLYAPWNMPALGSQ